MKTLRARIEELGASAYEEDEGEAWIEISAVLNALDQFEIDLRRIRMEALRKDDARNSFWLGYATGIDRAIDAVQETSGEQ